MKIELLEELGLAPAEIEVYEAILTTGITHIHHIQKATGIERRNIYDNVNKLIDKGLITYTQEQNAKVYQAASPETIKQKIEQRRERLRELEEQLPQMNALFESTKPPIGARVFRGNEAMKTLLEEVLTYENSYWIGGNSGVENTTLKHWFWHWMKRREDNEHTMHDLVDHGTYLEAMGPSSVPEKHYLYCELPKDFASPMVMIIYGDNVAQILWSKRSFAFVMQSAEIKESFMKYFDYFWNA